MRLRELLGLTDNDTDIHLNIINSEGLIYCEIKCKSLLIYRIFGYLLQYNINTVGTTYDNELYIVIEEDNSYEKTEN